MSFTPATKSSSPVRGTPIMLSSPYYRRSIIRPILLVGVALLAFYTLYNQAQLRHHTLYLQEAISEGALSFYQTNRTHNNTLYQSGTEDHVAKEFDFGRNPCAHFPKDSNGILLVLKTGATEVFDKLPTHLLTSLQCLPDFLLFSDREQQIGQWHIYDSLDTVSDKIKTDNPEFDLYRRQQECPVSQKSCLKTYRGQAGTAAWALDKYKFMHILQRTWEMRPNQSYYLFGEADTYIVWPNLVEWLKTRSPVENPLEEPLYLGSAAMLAGIPFAHGGSGYILSGALVRNLVEGNTDIGEVFDAKARTHCCGDQMIAKAVLEQNLKVRNAHPMFNGEKPSTFPYGPSHWCEPAMTMHHVDAEEISSIWQFEQTRKDKGFMVYKDLFEAFVANKLVDERIHWDNQADDTCYADPDPLFRSGIDEKQKKRFKKEELMNAVERDAYKSRAHCARVCEYEGYEDAEVEVNDEEFALMKQDGNVDANGPRPMKKVLRFTRVTRSPLDRRCFQWRYHNGICCTGRSFRLGAPRRDAEGNAQDVPERVWHSGWHLDYINNWINAKGGCDAPRWKVPDRL